MSSIFPIDILAPSVNTAVINCCRKLEEFQVNNLCRGKPDPSEGNKDLQMCVLQNKSAFTRLDSYICQSGSVFGKSDCLMWRPAPV